MTANSARAIQGDELKDEVQPLDVRPIRCLLLDDSRFDRRRVMHTAARAGLKMDVTEVSTVAEARKVLTDQAFSLHIFDFMLPDGDGIAFAREALANPSHKTVPTIILSGKGEENTSISAIIAGCADYLTKDALSPETFHHSVIGALHKATLRAENAASDQDKDAIRTVLDALCESHLEVAKGPVEDLAARAEALRKNGATSSELQKAIDHLAENCETISGYLEEIEAMAKSYRD